ncbi:MAG: YggS family pyridoxal phosphate-dependent enzyme [Terriglobia bacterium]
MPEAFTLAARLQRVQERIQVACRRAGRTDAVTLVAVTKTITPDRIAEAHRCGLRHFGENRVQEFEAKRRSLTLPAATWHLVGHLQSNKARRAVELFDCVESLDTSRLAHRLDQLAAAAGRRLPVLLQVHLGDEPAKFGVAEADLAPLAEQVAALPHLELRGLMLLPPYFDDPQQVRPFFRRLRQLAEEIARRQIPGLTLTELSMGMSHDFEVAIEEGATTVRLGTALFGPRPTKP